MPHRMNEFRAKIQFITSAEMPSLIYRACVKTQTISNTAYIQRAVAEALSRDLGIPLGEIMEKLPPHRGRSAALFHGTRHIRTLMPGPSNTVEQVR